MSRVTAASAAERPLADVARSTVKALFAPRRLVAILVVVLPLLALQVNYSDDPLALPLGAAMCTSFLLGAPTLWRYWFPVHGPSRRPFVHGLLYAGSGLLLMLGIGRGVPALTGLGYTFLTTRPSLLVCVALYWVGGWGLARDIDLEEGYRKERERAEGLAREAEHAQLLALRSHLDPHFLFNTLNAIAEWCRQDGVVAEKAILELSALLRTVMEGIKTEVWPLAREIELTEALIDLHRIRDPELFSYERVGDVPALDVPPLLLLPMSENAMKHGPHAGHRGKVTLRIESLADQVLVSLQNPGPFRGKRVGGEGLGIVEARLRLAYGERASFSIEGAEGATLATVRIPKGTR